MRSTIIALAALGITLPAAAAHAAKFNIRRYDPPNSWVMWVEASSNFAAVRECWRRWGFYVPGPNTIMTAQPVCRSMYQIVPQSSPGFQINYAHDNRNNPKGCP